MENNNNNNSRRTKLKEVATDAEEQPPPSINFFIPQPQQFAAPSSSANPPDGQRLSNVQQILNNAAPFVRPFSYTALLMADDLSDVISSSIGVKIQTQQPTDQILMLHDEKLRRELGGLMQEHYSGEHQAVEERAAKKLKEKEQELQENLAMKMEMERKAMQYKAEAERLALRARYLEQETMYLRSGLVEAMAARRCAENAQESSFEEVAGVKIDCRACKRQGAATVMLWPCCHVSVCTQCEPVVRVCPICLKPKSSSVEVCLSQYPVN